MANQALLATIRRYALRHPDEDVCRFARFVRRQPRCFERDCFDDGHITGSAVLLDASANAMLMTLHAKLGRWLQLGGHADCNSDPLAVACREAREESGLGVTPVLRDPIDLDIHAIPPLGDDPAHLHYDLRFLLVAERAPLAISDESLALKWVPLGDVASMTREDSILRLVDKARRRIAGAWPRQQRDLQGFS